MELNEIYNEKDIKNFKNILNKEYYKKNIQKIISGHIYYGEIEKLVHIIAVGNMLDNNKELLKEGACKGITFATKYGRGDIRFDVSLNIDLLKHYDDTHLDVAKLFTESPFHNRDVEYYESIEFHEYENGEEFTIEHCYLELYVEAYRLIRLREKEIIQLFKDFM